MLAMFVIFCMALISELLKYELEKRIKLDAEADLKARNSNGQIEEENSTKTARHMLITGCYILLRGINYCQMLIVMSYSLWLLVELVLF